MGETGVTGGNPSQHMEDMHTPLREIEVSTDLYTPCCHSEFAYCVFKCLIIVHLCCSNNQQKCLNLPFLQRWQREKEAQRGKRHEGLW